MDHPEHPQIYLATPLMVDTQKFPTDLALVLDATPVACLQLRLASEDVQEITHMADICREVAHERDVPMVIQQHARLVEQLGLDGVHLNDGRGLRELRKTLGTDAIIGCSCGNSRHDGMAAAEAGADYISFGPVGAALLGEPALQDLFEWWSDMIEVPVIAEGGITSDIAQKLRAHVDFFAFGDEIWSADDPVRTIQDYAQILSGA